jgi:hypothetical protein
VSTPLTPRLQLVQRFPIDLSNIRRHHGFLLMIEYIKKPPPHCCCFNSRSDTAEKRRRHVSTSINMGPYVIVTGGAASGHAISFHSPMMSALFYPKNVSSPNYANIKL